MRLEPTECRLQALTCERLAQGSTSPIVKGAYADLPKKWLKVADELQAVNNAAKSSTYRQKEEAPDSIKIGASQNGSSAASRGHVGDFSPPNLLASKLANSGTNSLAQGADERVRSMLCLASSTASSIRRAQVLSVGCAMRGRSARVR